MLNKEINSYLSNAMLNKDKELLKSSKKAHVF